MKLLKSLVGLAAVASVIPFAVDKKEDGKSFTAKALLWKVDYKAATDEENGHLNINILGDFVDGVKDAASKVFDSVRPEKEAEPDFCEETVTVDGEAVECECEEAEEVCECEAETEEVTAD